jgi:toxin ParE1/3/4
MPGRFKVIITRSAEADIATIWDFISQDSTENATHFILKIEAQINSLKNLPLRCPIIKESSHLGIAYRHFIIDKYRIIFKIIEDEVIILRIIHSAKMLSL